MSKYLLYVATLVLSITMAACATRYQSRGFSGGYVERQIDVNTYNVAFSGNGYTSSDHIDKSLLYRCAELTTAAGYDYFVIVEGHMTRGEPYFTTPGSRNVATATIKVFRGAKPVNNPNAYAAQAILQTLGPQITTQSTTGNGSQTADQHRNEAITPPTEVPRTAVLPADALQRGRAAYDRQDYLTAFREWLPLAQQGYAPAQNNLGVMYTKGQSVVQDDAEAVRWYSRAAAQSYALAQNNLGWMYAEGRGVAKDDAEAVSLYRQAAAQGNAYAHGNLGQMYEQGRGVTRDLVEAQRWYAKAAELYPPGPKRIAAIEARDRVARQLTSQQVPVTPPTSVTPLPSLSASPPPTPRPALSSGDEIPLVKVGGVYELPVEINGVLTLKFVLDSGAAEVNLPADVVLTLVRTGTIKETDFLPGKTYTLADGLPVNSARFLLRSLKIGARRVANVAGSIGPVSSPLLLGQSFLEKLGAWGIDNQRQVLVIHPGASQTLSASPPSPPKQIAAIPPVSLTPYPPVESSVADQWYRHALKDYQERHYESAVVSFKQFLRHVTRGHPQAGNAQYLIGEALYTYCIFC